MAHQIRGAFDKTMRNCRKLQIIEGGISLMELQVKVGIPMVTKLRNPKQRYNETKHGLGRKGKRHGLLAWEGTRMVKGKKL